MTDIQHRVRRHGASGWTGAFVLGTVLAAVGCGGGGGYGGGGGMTTPPPGITIAVNPTSIVLGQSTTLTWTASAGSTCTASGGWSGAQDATGTATETPTAVGTVTYTLGCTGSGAYAGSATGSATLTVTAPTTYAATALVGDTAGVAAHQDTNLVNPWGLAFSPTSFVWVANNHSETSTLYDGNGVAQPFATPLIVATPDGPGPVSFDPTGIVFNGTGTFAVTNGTTTASAPFLFVGEGGMIGGWAPSVDGTHVKTMFTATDGAVYKGLAIAKIGTANYIYATDFHNNKVDVLDSTFTKQTSSATAFTFVDPTLPAGYAPFGIQAINNGTGGATQLYVSYAMQAAPDNHDNSNGAGLGLVDIFDTNGAFVAHLIPVGGLLNAPWGMALAPADFGTLSNTLLVGNFGDGTINGYDPATGALVGTLQVSGAAFASPGLWGISFGNDAHNQPHNTLFYAAGPNDEANGLYGRIDVGTAPVLGAPPVVAFTAPSGTVSGAAVTLTATAVDPIGVSKVEFFIGTTSLGVVTTSPYTITWDSTTVADGSVTLKATATDADGIVGSATVAVTVSNTTPATTLATIQANVFGPKCSGCHDGSSNTLPGSQNLSSAASSFAALVGVASVEQPALMRVKPNDSANSYLIHKVEGAPGITGSQMPKGGTPLDQATIDSIKSWIDAGALNN